jgi:MoxR-like ATPase
LPEAQIDRFLLRTHLGYPDKNEEMRIMELFQESDPLAQLEAVSTPEEITELQQARRKIHVSEPIREYIAAIVRATRDHEAIRYGASPRGSLGLMRAGQALAALRGREYILPDDIKYLVRPVIAHRLIFRDVERLRGADADRFIAELVESVPVPVA